jgi:hypothetical protein
MWKQHCFCGYKVGGAEGVNISHLRFDDDTLIMGETIWANIPELKANLILFEIITRIKVNFHK